MRKLKTLLFVLLPTVLVASACWSQTTTAPTAPTKPKAVRSRASKAKSKAAEAMPPGMTMPKAAEAGKSTVKGYTTKSGKVVKPYERKATTKMTPPTTTTPSTKSKKPSSTMAPSGEKTVHVHGYTTKSGKVVKPYTRRAPTKKQ